MLRRRPSSSFQATACLADSATPDDDAENTPPSSSPLLRCSDVYFAFGAFGTVPDVTGAALANIGNSHPTIGEEFLVEIRAKISGGGEYSQTKALSPQQVVLPFSYFSFLIGIVVNAVPANDACCSISCMLTSPAPSGVRRRAGTL